jgi:uncharacterized protein involved in exopolysaccharide biosynthesis
VQRRDIEDITHVLARRKWLIVAVVVVAAVLSVAYAGIGKSGITSEVSISIDAPIALTARPAEILDAGREAARLTDLLESSVDNPTDEVGVRADLLRRAVIVRATAQTQAAADALAAATAERYIERRQAEFADDLEVERVLRRQRVDALQQQIDELDESMVDAPTDQSSALRDQRLQLIQEKLNQQTELAAVELTIERGDVGLTATLPTPGGSSTSSVGLVLFVVVGGLLGLFSGCALALALDSLDHRLYTRRDVEAVGGGTQHVAVLGEDDPDGLANSELTLLQRVSPSGSVILRATHRDIEGDERLEELGFPIASDLSDVPAGESVIVALRQGVTTDAELVHRLTALDVCGSPVAALLLYNVPLRELDWARRR